jgi:hypothetical protein
MPVKSLFRHYGIHSMKLYPIAAIFMISPSLVWLKFDFKHPCGLPKVLQNVTLALGLSALFEYVHIWFHVRREISWLVEWLPAFTRVFTSWSYVISYLVWYDTENIIEMMWHVTFPQASCSIYYCCLNYSDYVVMNGRVTVSDYLRMW